MPIDNPTLCCLMGVCCGAKAQQQALANRFYSSTSHAEDADHRYLCDQLATALLADFDLVPKGIGAAIVAGYRASFAERPLPLADPAEL